MVDNCAAHTTSHELLSHITICFLPLNTTSHLQPMDQGIIRSLKSHYRNFLVQFWLRFVNENQKFRLPNALEAVFMINMAWEKVSAKVIQNCFAHSGIFSVEQECQLRDIAFIDNSTIELKESLAEYTRLFPNEKEQGIMEVESFIHFDDNTETNENDSIDIEEIVNTVLEEEGIIVPKMHQPQGIENEESATIEKFFAILKNQNIFELDLEKRLEEILNEQEATCALLNLH